jgi:Family of unknown function (DUF5682)
MTRANLHIVPIRHHSPACASHLLALLDDVKPVAILIEGPCNFDPLIPLVTDEATKTPIAIVSVDERKQDDDAPTRRVVSYFPFCSHSPEYIALQYGNEHKIACAFIDLPANDRAMAGEADDEQPVSLLTDERMFSSGDYVRALCQTFGCRDGNEVWDHLFETRLHETDWRRFFGDVGIYCEHIRGATTQAAMKADGTLARETQMRAIMAETIARVSGPVVVIVGGFHASAVVDPTFKPSKPKAAAKGSATAYLVRYGDRQLNALSGYSAGLPLPAYYDGLWRKHVANPGVPIFGDYAQDLVLAFSAHLKTALPSAVPALPVITTALENAHQLANLRGRPGPLRDDILDAMRSSLLKGEEAGEGAPILTELMAFMTGSAIGNVPPSAGSPPLVEAVRAKAKALGFSVDDGQRRNRDLDFYRKDRHRAASRYLHGMRFLETGFGERLAGPDFASGVDLDRLSEQWAVAWSPMVEARLVELSADADTLEGAVSISVKRRLEALRTAGQGNNAVAAIGLFAAACQAGVAHEAATILPFIESDVIADPEPASVAGALRALVILWRGGKGAGIDDRAPIEALIGAAWRRALFLVPTLEHAGEDRVKQALDALITLREIVTLSDDGLAAIDASLFDEAIAALLTQDLHPAIAGAVCAIALLQGQIDDDYLGTRITGELNSAYVEMKGRVEFLRGMLSVSRELLWAVPTIIEAIDALMQQADATDFTEILPHLRLGFSLLDPRDIDRLARMIGEKHNGDAAALVAEFGVSQSEQAANAALDQRLLALLMEDGLA